MARGAVRQERPSYGSRHQALDPPSMPRTSRRPRRRIAFVLGGGGRLGACEVGMLRALFERDIVPHLIVGTSIGAMNGAAAAVEPSSAAIDRLEEVWTTLDRNEVFSGSVLSGAK